MINIKDLKCLFKHLNLFRSQLLLFLLILLLRQWLRNINNLLAEQLVLRGRT